VLEPARTVLFVPADQPRKVERALASSADAVILDLEDAVAPEQREAARAAVEAAARSSHSPALFVRVNDPLGDDGARDLELVRELALGAVVVPKADPERLDALGPLAAPVVAIVETAAGLAGVERVAANDSVGALMLGAEDLALELRLEPLPGEQHLLFPRSRLVMHSAAAGIAPPLDTVHVDVGDDAGLAASAARARALGFGGKACVHPRQLDVVAEAFAPRAEEVAWASRVVEAFERERPSGGVIAIDGQMVDRPVLERARRVLEGVQR
jgi:citrate lyase beta subunit